jgi:hypothetical protein
MEIGHVMYYILICMKVKNIYIYDIIETIFIKSLVKYLAVLSHTNQNIIYNMSYLHQIIFKN